ncbi:MAG: hypothetical protein HQK51_17385 [Oligoflexia bacterium]|nr:hypothetical protein [Oligoflexia bacterium]
MDKYSFKFNPGFDKNKYLLKMLDGTYDTLLPKELILDVGYGLNNKSFTEIFTQTDWFAKNILSQDILLNIDDSAFMLSLMAHTTPQNFNQKMLINLIDGGRSLKNLVNDFNINAIKLPYS